MRRYPSVSPLSISERRCSSFGEELLLDHLPKQQLKYFFYAKTLKRVEWLLSPQYANSWHQVELRSTLYVQYAFHSGEVAEHVGKILFQLSFEPKIRLFVCMFCFCNQLSPGKRFVQMYIYQVTFAAVYDTPQLQLAWAKQTE